MVVTMSQKMTERWDGAGVDAVDINIIKDRCER
jgi:hypothetical protein